MKKIILGMVTVGVMAMGGNLEPEWVSVHRYVMHKTMTVDGRKNTPYGGVRNGGIWHGYFSSSLGNLTDGKVVEKKIVIKQKVPCFVAKLHYDEYKNDFNKWTHKNRTTIKRDGKNIIITLKYSEYSTSERFTTLDKLRITDRKRATPNNAKLIAGDGYSCLDKTNSETWTVYWKLKGKWVAVAKEKMK